MPFVQDIVHHVDQFGLGVRHRAVIAVAVGRLEHEHVGLTQRIAVPHDERRRFTQVARNDEQSLPGSVTQADLGERRPDDVSGAVQSHRHGRVGSELDSIRHGVQAQREAVDVLGDVERRFFGPRAAASRCLPVAARLHMGAVLQHDGHQVGRRLRAVDLRSAPACRSETGQQPAVIDVRVGQQHEIEPAELARIGLTVLAGCLAPALEHSVVDQEADITGLDHQAGPGDLAGSTMECQTHLRMLQAVSMVSV